MRVRQDVTFEQMKELTNDLGRRKEPLVEASRINFEERTLLLYLRPGATPAEQQSLRATLLRSPIVVGVDP